MNSEEWIIVDVILRSERGPRENLFEVGIARREDLPEGIINYSFFMLG